MAPSEATWSRTGQSIPVRLDCGELGHRHQLEASMPTRRASLTLAIASPTMNLGRAKRGDSGALYSQSALARLNPSRRSTFRSLCLGQPVLRAGSHAAEGCESRQVRKEAAVSSIFRVPWVRLARADVRRYVSGSDRTGGARPVFVALPLCLDSCRHSGRARRSDSNCPIYRQALPRTPVDPTSSLRYAAKSSNRHLDAQKVVGPAFPGRRACGWANTPRGRGLGGGLCRGGGAWPRHPDAGAGRAG